MLLAAVAVLVVVTATPASAEPVQDQQCRDRTWAKLHPQICYKYNGGPFGIGGGGGDDRGLIGRILGGLTGGIL